MGRRRQRIWIRIPPALVARSSLMVVGLALGGCGSPAADRGGSPALAPAGEASTRLQRLGDDFWSRQLERDAVTRLTEGLPIEELPQLSYGEAEADAEFAGAVLARADSIDPAGLSHAELLTLETLRWESEMAVEGLQYFWLGSVLTPYSSPLRAFGVLFPQLPLADEEDLERYLALLRQVPRFVGQIQDLARGQFERQYVVSAQNMAAVTGLVRAVVQPPESGPFAVEDGRLAGFGPERAASFRGEIASVVSGEINPALDELAGFLEGAYAEAAPSGVGVTRYPNGRDYYLYLVRLHTTMDVTPEEVQQAGHELLAEFERRMAEIREEVGFEGTREEFHALLRSDPRFFPESPDEVSQRLMAASDAMFARIGDFFLGTPRAPYDVRRLAPELEPSMTYGYYSRPTAAEPVGYYNYNGSRLDQRSWLGLAAVSFHELIPGHHFQIATQYESEVLPQVRRQSYYTAYGEGWGSYASFLGLEAGLYADPYSRYGLYILESFLASRLVVDPGMNWFGMSLEEARQFMRENTLESETQIATETLRYSTDLPGQALGYQMGKRKLLELRRRAEEALGERFDVRRFHAAILDHGPLPMVVLERHVEWWIDQELARP